MSAAVPSLRHDALLYASESEFVSALEPFAFEGLADGEDVIAATTEANIAALREALGPKADSVTFLDAADWYRHPARTIASYRNALDKCFAEGAKGVRVIGEIQFGDTASAQREWVRYESALNEAFADDPAWIVCPYDVRELPSWLVEHARRTHPHVRSEQGRATSPAYTDTEQLLTEVPSSSLEPAVPPHAEWLVDGDLAALRRALRDAAGAFGMNGENLDQLTLAVNEAVTNALTHGKAPVSFRMYRDNGSLLCEVEDAGSGIGDPLAGYIPPAAAARPEGGMGLWLARQLCDRVAVLEQGGRTFVRLAKRLDHP